MPTHISSRRIRVAALTLAAVVLATSAVAQLRQQPLQQQPLQQQPLQQRPLQQRPPAPPAEVMVNLLNGLDVGVDTYYRDQSGAYVFWQTLPPGQPQAFQMQPGLGLAFGVNGQPVGEYLVGNSPNQSFTIGGGGGGVAGAPPAGQSMSGAAPAGGQSPVDEFGMSWNFYAGDGGEAVLIYGVPETDDSILAATCRQGSGVAEFDFLSSPDVGGPGAPVIVDFRTVTGPIAADADARENGRPAATVSQDSPVIMALSQPGRIGLSIAGADMGEVNTTMGDPSVERFYAYCGLPVG